VGATKSQDAVITEISEQYVEEASTAEVGTRPAVESSVQDAPSVEPAANVQIAVGAVGDVPAAMHVNLPLERFSSLGQRDGYESREASNGTGLYGYDEKVEAGIKCPSHPWLFGHFLSFVLAQIEHNRSFGFTTVTIMPLKVLFSCGAS